MASATSGEEPLSISPDVKPFVPLGIGLEHRTIALRLVGESRLNLAEMRCVFVDERLNQCLPAWEVVHEASLGDSRLLDHAVDGGCQCLFQ